MFQFKLFTFITLGLIISSCEGNKNDLNNLFSIDTTSLKQIYQQNESVNFTLTNVKNKTIDSITYSVNDKKIGSVKGNEKLSYSLENQKLGYQKIHATVYFEELSAETETNFTIVAQNAPKLLTYKILNTYPHDIKAYTQGFEFYRDTLIEGTGNGAGNGTGIRGTSSLRKTNYKTGEVYKTVELAPIYFGEGITILNDKIFQLTWKSKMGFVYNLNDFKLLNSFNYNNSVEGWGLCNDGKYIYKSDGTEKIWKLDSNNLEEIDFVNVVTNNKVINKINELEWFNNKIYANTYQFNKEVGLIINPINGQVEGVIDFSGLKEKVKDHPKLDVLNGIAYNKKRQTFFITGKNWNKLFEIQIVEKKLIK